MSSNIHVMFSNTIKGAGIIMGGSYTYWVERNKFQTPDKVLATNIIAQTEMKGALNAIDPLQNLKGSPLYLLFGSEDDVLVKGVTEKANDYYKWFGADVKYERIADLAHVMPTDLPYDPIKHADI